MGLTNLAVLPFSNPFPWYDIRQVKLPRHIQEKFSYVYLEESMSESFNGEPYVELIDYLTSYSLYDDYLSPEAVKDIHSDLQDHVEDNQGSQCLENKKAVALELFFRICVENNLGVVSLVTGDD